MNVAQMRTHGYYSYEFLAFASATLTANSPETGSDGVYQDGVKIDRFSLQSLFLSGKVIAPITVTGLAGGDTVAVKAKIQDCDTEDGVYEDVEGLESEPVVYDEDGSFVFSANMNLAGARRWIRVSLMATFAATGTDTVVAAAVLQVAGHDELPVTATPADES